ncbi:FAD-binding protein [Ruegeria sp. HKCCD6228]|uniref:FAD-binding oxidoreductase n=1 Tax=Ruegeria sp. HKCCD6228 TaxID=2683001 RepID=UPI00149264D3|nr:FAD-binding oxidoreductase [Ruegeria sp. HKCCD6228]NOD97444.1 FAD-binding protein [Ruegeria sp. HKCCD6228]
MSLNPADDRFAALLRSKLGDGVLRPVEERYLEEPRGRFSGRVGLLALPRNTEEVALLVRLAAQAQVPIVPYGGGTGLVGGQVMSAGPAPLVISLERMTAIRSVFPTENVLVAEAGAVLQDVQTAAEAVDRLFPLSLAAQGSCRIGGNLSTNAGGVNVLRYGNARDLCLGLEAVLPNGEIWHGLSRLRKDNTGYDLRNLLIGAEGTLGIITAASLKLFPRPAGVGTAVFHVASPEAAIDLLALARDKVGEAVSTFELIHRQGLDFLTEVLPDVRQPFASPPEWSVLIELGLADGHSPFAALEGLFVRAEELGQVQDGVIAQSEAQRADLWAVRERIPEANRLIGSVSSHDISIPISRIPDFICEGRKLIAGLGPFRISCFGHLGDGNLHYNVFPPKGRHRSEFDDQRGAIKQAVHDLVYAFDGSVSAEHGVGRLKTNDLERYGDPAKLGAMRAIKLALDPQGIMNPGAVLKG